VEKRAFRFVEKETDGQARPGTPSALSDKSAFYRFGTTGEEQQEQDPVDSAARVSVVGSNNQAAQAGRKFNCDPGNARTPSLVALRPSVWPTCGSFDDRGLLAASLIDLFSPPAVYLFTR
jgi:hypothetical protein